MSSATPSHTAPTATDEQSFATAWADRLVESVRASAFWAAAVLPLLVIAGLLTGWAGQYPTALGLVLVINVVCAVVGHNHSPNR